MGSQQRAPHAWRRRGPKPSARRERPKEAPSFSSELHRLRLALFAANQARISESIEGYSAAFRRYEARYQATVQRARGPSTYGAMLEATRRARLVIAGDYHTFPPAQRAFLRLLEEQPADPPVVVALEMILGRHQRWLDRFLAGEINERTFLRKIDLARNWPFGAADGLRAILAAARTRSWPVIGVDLEATGDDALGERDRYVAERIATALSSRPGARAFVLIGECHLAPDHLPRAAARAFSEHKIEGRVLRVHQNPDSVWFDLDARGLAEEHDVLELDDDAFALLTASPLVCQQSFLTWLEQAEEGSPHAPIEDPESGERLVHQALEVIGRSLGLPARRCASRIEVVGPHDLSFFERLESSGQFDRRELRQVRAHVLSSESYYIPRARMIYLATMSLSHAAEEAAHALRHHLSGEGIDETKLLRDAFYCRVMNEAIGFLGSKLVNPKRRCPHPEELARLAGDASSLDAEAATLVLAHKQLEKGRPTPELARAFQSSAEVFNAVTHLLGYIIGDQLYYALMRGRVSRREVRALFFEPFEEEGAALAAYFDLVGRVGRVRVPRSRAPAI